MPITEYAESLFFDVLAFGYICYNEEWRELSGARIRCTQSPRENVLP